MSHLLTGLIACPDIQTAIDNNFLNCDPTKLQEYTPLVQFLNSSANTNNILNKTVSPGRGKLRNVNIVYTPRVRETEVRSDTTTVCTSTNESGMISESYSLDPAVGVSIDETFIAADLRAICKDNQTYLTERMQAMMDGARRKLETKLTTDAIALIGSFAAGESDVANNIKTVRTKFSDGKPDTNMLEEVDFATMNANYCSQPYIFGYDEAYKYYKRLEVGCCADSGLDLGRALSKFGKIFMPSNRIPTAFGNSTDFLTVSAGALQLITYNAYEGAEFINTISSGDHQELTVIDPMTGLKWDMLINRPCGGNLTIQFKLAYKLVGMPDDMFSVGDRYRGVTGVNRFRITNP